MMLHLDKSTTSNVGSKVMTSLSFSILMIEIVAVLEIALSKEPFVFEFTATHNAPRPRIQLTAILARISI